MNDRGRPWTASDIDALAALTIKKNGANARLVALRRAAMFASLGEPADAERWRLVAGRIEALAAGDAAGGRD